MNRIHDLLDELENYVDSAEKKLEVAGVNPKYTLGQKVWILKGDIPSWYNFPIHTGKEKCEDAFEEEEIKKIIICKLNDSNTRNCGLTGPNPIVVTYEFNRYMYYDKILLEKNVYSSLWEAVKQNKSAFEADLQRWIEEKNKDKEEKKLRLKSELDSLS